MSEPKHLNVSLAIVIESTWEKREVEGHRHCDSCGDPLWRGGHEQVALCRFMAAPLNAPRARLNTNVIVCESCLEQIKINFTNETPH